MFVHREINIGNYFSACHCSDWPGLASSPPQTRSSSSSSKVFAVQHRRGRQ